MNDTRYQVIEAYEILAALVDCRKSTLWVYMEMIGGMPFANCKDGGQMVDVDKVLEQRLMKAAGATSKRTLGDIMCSLCKRELMRKAENGKYQINPHYAYRGDGRNRKRVCEIWDEGRRRNHGYQSDIPF